MGRSHVQAVHASQSAKPRRRHENRHRRSRDRRSDNYFETGTDMRIAFVGWRGMVGSVLLQRMVDEKDFDLIDTTFFSASRAGGAAPVIGGKTAALKDANDAAAFRDFDAIVTCQGGDWTEAMYAKIR